MNQPGHCTCDSQNYRSVTCFHIEGEQKQTIIHIILYRALWDGKGNNYLYSLLRIIMYRCTTEIESVAVFL